MVSGPTPQNAPKSLNWIEPGAVAWQTIKPQMAMGCHRLLHDRTLMPRGIVYEDDHLRMGLSWVGSGNIMQMSHKGHLKPPGFALAALLFDPSGLF